MTRYIYFLVDSRQKSSSQYNGPVKEVEYVVVKLVDGKVIEVYALHKYLIERFLKKARNHSFDYWDYKQLGLKGKNGILLR